MMKKDKQHKRTFARLADIYLQNPHFLRRDQLYSILEMARPRLQSIVNPSHQTPQKHPTETSIGFRKVQQRTLGNNIGFEGELQRRKLDANFRISAKLVERIPKTYIHQYNDSTIEIGDLESPQLLKPQNNKKIFRRGSPVINEHKQHLSNSTAEPSIATTVKDSSYFRRYRYDKKSSQQIKREESFNTRPSTVHHQTRKKNTRLLSFVLNSKDEYVRRELERHNWRQNKVLDSTVYTLKWSYKDDPEDFRTLQQPSCLERYFNHIKNNDMTSKVGLYRLYRQLAEAGCNPHTYMPRTHDSNDQDDIATDYELTALQCILKNHVKYFRHKIPQKVKFLAKILKKRLERGITEQILEQFAQFPQEDILDQQFVVNITIVKQMLGLMQRKVCLSEGFQESGKWDYLRTDAKVLKTLFKFSKLQPPYERYLQFGRSNMFDSNSRTEVKNSKPDSPSKNSRASWRTPSMSTVYRCLLYDEYFKQKMPSYEVEGTKNIWIMKLFNSSRGQGISLTDKLDVILDSKNKGRLAQKYIEDIWLLDQSKVQNLDAAKQQQLRSHVLYCKKFDLRQWVLISCVNPLSVYIFSEFYLKVCPQKYTCESTSNLSQHLSNYSFNKHSFADPTDSILSEEAFTQLLKTLGIDIKPLKQRISEIITHIVRVGSESFEYIAGTFQLVGFDILLDSKLQPWVLEINMSPACSQRAEWVTPMLEQMIRKTLAMVIPRTLYIPEDLDHSRHNWVPLIESDKFEGKHQKLSVVGTKFQLMQQRKRQKLFRPAVQKYQLEQYSKIMRLQTVIRQFLKKIKQQPIVEPLAEHLIEPPLPHYFEGILDEGVPIQDQISSATLIDQTI